MPAGAATGRDHPDRRRAAGRARRPRRSARGRLERRLARLRVVRLDRLDRGDGLVDRREREERLAGRERIAEAGVLGDDRTAGGEVRRAAVAEPAGPQPHVLVLRDRELAARASDVVAVGIEVGGEVERVAHAPPAALEQLAILRRVARERQLEVAARERREGQELAELLVLAPAVALAVEA